MNCDREGCPDSAEWRPAIRWLMKPLPGRSGRPRSWDMELKLAVCSAHTRGIPLSDFMPNDKLLKVAEIVHRNSHAQPPVREDAQLVWLPLGSSFFDKEEQK